MDNALQIQIAIIVFILFLCIVCFFAVMIILHNIIAENNKKAPEPVKEPEPIPEPVIEEEPVKEDVEEDDNAVVFSSHILTMPERYATLSTEFKSYFDDIVRYALSKENVKESRHNYFYAYKDASYRVLRLTIKRGEIICELNFVDREIKEYVDGSNVPMKQSLTSIKVTEPAAVGVVKDGIDLVCSQISAYREYKKQLAKEKRREKRNKNKQSSEQEGTNETINV